MSEEPGSSVVAGLAKLAMVLRQEAWQKGAGRAGAGKRGRGASLTPTQAQILAFLQGRGSGGTGESVSRIASELALTLPTVSESVTAIERKGLVRRVRAEDDGRSVLVALTAKGSRAAERSAEWPDSLLAAAGALDESERDALLRCLVKMIRSLQDSGRIPVARMCVSCVHFRPNAHADNARPHHCAFVDAPFGDRELRIDCNDHQPVSDETGQTLWQLFVRGSPVGTAASTSRRRAEAGQRRATSD